MCCPCPVRPGQQPLCVCGLKNLLLNARWDRPSICCASHVHSKPSTPNFLNKCLTATDILAAESIFTMHWVFIALATETHTCMHIIAFPMSVIFIGVTVWLDTKTRSVTVVDAMHTSKVLAAVYLHVSGCSAHLIRGLSSATSCQY